jgi:hypothetical protein
LYISFLKFLQLTDFISLVLFKTKQTENRGSTLLSGSHQFKWRDLMCFFQAEIKTGVGPRGKFMVAQVRPNISAASKTSRGSGDIKY